MIAQAGAVGMAGLVSCNGQIDMDKTITNAVYILRNGPVLCEAHCPLHPLEIEKQAHCFPNAFNAIPEKDEN